MGFGAGEGNRTPDIQLGKLNENVENQPLSNKTAPNGLLLEQWVTHASQNRSLSKILKRSDVTNLLELHDWFASGKALRTLGKLTLAPELTVTAVQIERELIKRGCPVAPGSAIRGLRRDAL